MIADAFAEAVNGVMERRLDDKAQRNLVVTALLAGFANLQKKPVPDMAKRLTEIEGRMRLMVENVKLGFVNGRLKVKVVGSSESLMKELRHGTDWYAPWDKVDETVLAAILVDPARS